MTAHQQNEIRLVLSVILKLHVHNGISLQYLALTQETEPGAQSGFKQGFLDNKISIFLYTVQSIIL